MSLTYMEFVNRLTGHRYTKAFAKKMITDIRQHSEKSV